MNVSGLLISASQLTLAEELSFPPKELSPIHVSLAVTFADYGQFSQSLLYYQKNVQLWKGKDLLEVRVKGGPINRHSLLGERRLEWVAQGYLLLLLAEKGGLGTRMGGGGGLPCDFS